MSLEESLIVRSLIEDADSLGGIEALRDRFPMTQVVLNKRLFDKLDWKHEIDTARKKALENFRTRKSDAYLLQVHHAVAAQSQILTDLQLLTDVDTVLLDCQLVGGEVPGRGYLNDPRFMPQVVDHFRSRGVFDRSVWEDFSGLKTRMIGSIVKAGLSAGYNLAHPISFQNTM